MVREFLPIEDGLIEHLRLRGWTQRRIAEFMSTPDCPRDKRTIGKALERMALAQEYAET